MSVQIINPATEQLVREYGFMSPGELDAAVTQSTEAYPHWRRLDLKARLECVRTFENALQAALEVASNQITTEMGKVRKEAQAEVNKCIASCKILRENFGAWKAQKEYVLSSGHSVHYEPLGPLLGIMPWNFPLWQVIRFAIPALLCGNTVLLKHAPNTWGVAEFLEGLFKQAFPEGTYVNLRVGVPETSALIGDSRVRGVSLTGSRQAGQSVGELAGRHLKKCVLELGGSDAYIILDDADLDLAADVCARGRMVNAGQSCVAAKRFIVTKKNSAAFTERFQKQLEKFQYGDPLSATTGIGPLARRDLRDQLAAQVDHSVKQGARLLFGGQVPKEKGFYYPASLLVGVKPGQVAFDEELFGPVAAVIEADDEKQAIALANRSRYGLGGAVFSKDTARAKEIAVHEIEAGMVFINDFVKSDALVPFGGIKDSGIGRELGREGAFEFTNAKLVK
ncbi:MAG: aldehyde dehydrogenase family protein [Bdellovibrionales bacterium]|nr:aldehyde dehydrogenase family protein [Bdellovibrionales bacterium]